MKPIKITERNIMFTEPMGKRYDLNTGLLLGNQFNFVIDTGLGSGSVAPVLAYLGDSRKPVIVVNTHCHWDHIWGNWMFPHSVIIAHTLCRELMDRYWEEAIKINAGAIDGEVHKCLPNMTIDSRVCFPGEGVEIFHTPGHSADCISIYDKTDKVLYAGDNIGDTAEEIVPYIETDAETFRKTLEIYKRYNFDTVIAGHNKPQGPDIIPRMEAALASAWQRQSEQGDPE